jgi:hypothetical protein
MSSDTGIVGALISLLLPFCLGLCLAFALDRQGRLTSAERLGLAYPCGAVLVTAMMCGISLIDGRFTRAVLGLAVGLPVVALAWLAMRRKRRSQRERPTPLFASRLVEALLVVLLFSKVAYVLIEVLRRPLTAWDTFAVWGLRAKVWAARGSLVLDPHDPFYLGSGARLDYPPHVSLLQAWTAIWLGGWNDVLVNVPWAAYYVSAIVFLYGTIAARNDRTIALAAAFCLSGLPLFVVHASIAGYAELMLGVHFLIAVSMIYLWAAERYSPYLFFGLLFTLSLPYTKLDGIPLAVACLGVVTMQMRSLQSWRVRGVVLAGTTGLAVAAALRNTELRAFLASSQPHPEAIVPFFSGLFASGSWHLLWVFFLAVAALRMRACWGTPMAWLFANIAIPMAGLLYLFFFTTAARFAVLRSADSRLLLGLAPAALCFVFLAVAQALREGDGDSGDGDQCRASLRNDWMSSSVIPKR